MFSHIEDRIHKHPLFLNDIITECKIAETKNYILELNADAGVDQNIASPQDSISLDGTGSNGDITTWTWEVER